MGMKNYHLCPGSCLDPSKYPLEKVDLVLCDPPFKSSKKNYQQIRKKTQNKLKPIATFEDYLEDWGKFCQIIQERLLPSGYFCFKADDYTAREVYPITSQFFQYRYTIVWDKGSIRIGNKWRKRHEIIEIYTQKTEEKQIWNRPINPRLQFFKTIESFFGEEEETAEVLPKWHGKSLGLAFPSILQIHDLNDGEKGTKEKKTHINQTPISLWEPFLKYMSPKNGVILDPFMGSGSVLKAVQYVNYCENWDLDYWGIEIDPEYFKKPDSFFEVLEISERQKEIQKEIEKQRSGKSSFRETCG